MCIKGCFVLFSHDFPTDVTVLFISINHTNFCHIQNQSYLTILRYICCFKSGRYFGKWEGPKIEACEAFVTKVRRLRFNVYHLHAYICSNSRSTHTDLFHIHTYLQLPLWATVDKVNKNRLLNRPRSISCL